MLGRSFTHTRGGKHYLYDGVISTRNKLACLLVLGCLIVKHVRGHECFGTGGIHSGFDPCLLAASEPVPLLQAVRGGSARRLSVPFQVSFQDGSPHRIK